jgi:hypothetical protein
MILQYPFNIIFFKFFILFDKIECEFLINIFIIIINFIIIFYYIL